MSQSAATVSQGRNDLVEDGINQPSRHPLRQMWALSRNTEYQLGFDHDGARKRPYGRAILR
jgi:hypothetical protein